MTASFGFDCSLSYQSISQTRTMTQTIVGDGRRQVPFRQKYARWESLRVEGITHIRRRTGFDEAMSRLVPGAPSDRYVLQGKRMDARRHTEVIGRIVTSR
jgi:hypothetical protein